MNIVLVSTYFEPEISSVTHLFSDLTRDLVRMGHRVSVVCSRPNRGLSAEERKRYENISEEEILPGLTVFRVGKTEVEKGGLVRRGMKFIGDTLALYRKALSLDGEVYLINSMPPYLGLAGALLKKKGKKTCYILQDLFPDSIIAMEKLSEHGPITAVCRFIERKSLFGNDALITISEDMKDTLVKKGVSREKITVIPNWSEYASEETPAREDNPVAKELRLDGDGFYAVYAGALGILQTPEVILDAALLLKEDHPDIRFLIFGKGGLEDRIREKIEAEGITNASLYPIRPVEEAELVYALGDVCLVPLKRGVTEIAMPSKTWSAMAAGRPVIAAASAGSCLARQVREAGSFCFEPEDAASLAEVLRDAYGRRKELKGLGEKARNYLKENQSRHASVEAYEKLLKVVCGKE